MNTSSRSLASRALLTVFVFLVGALVASAGCGRSNLDDYLADDGGPLADVTPDVIHPEGGPVCNAATCPTGCCDAAGVCQTGGSLTSCGSAGEACHNCQAEGFQLCDATRHACGNTVVNCGPQSCNGCCDGNVCFAGGDPNECGGGGQSCGHCQSEGLACSGGRCVAPACGPGTCSGCCFGGQCIAGTDDTACGGGGQQCENCSSIGDKCVLEPGIGGQCVGGGGCGPQNCSGCCSGNVCFSGYDAQECGYGGQSCQNCASFGEYCQNGVCAGTTFCGPQNCSGCCEGDICVLGGSSTACGYGGMQCQNCQAFGEVCTNGYCSGSATCGPQNCAGCCVGNVCMLGTGSSACGYGGSTCQNCQAFGETCQGGSCIGQTNCGPANCPGCCGGTSCQVGNQSSACGFAGAQCQDCNAAGETCSNGACVFQPTCNSSNCSGCCMGNTCVAGGSSTACGVGGAACEDCAATGATCSGGACVAQSCGPWNCTGCCIGNACYAGSADGACGQAGAQCQSCTQLGESCQNQACVAPTTCGPWNCNGCCAGNTCIDPYAYFDGGVPFDGGSGGQPDTECGYGGAQCQDCTKLGDTCQYEQCLPKCNQYNCSGCCDANQNCQLGFLDSQCGGQGNACQDCTKLTPPSTCDGAAFPVACQSQQTSCPSPYSGCFAPPTTAPFAQKVCSAADLLNAKAACSGGAYTPACYNFFGVEYQQNPSCASCLQPFDYDLADMQGVYACIAPYVNASCNQATACDYDCRIYSCGSCPDTPSYDQCRATVDAAGGQCQSYSQPAQQCEQKAIAGAAAFCDPAKYSGYGAWLQAVGQTYCGQ